MTHEIAQELDKRFGIWEELVKKGGTEQVQPRRLKELGIYGGAQGIWVDKRRTHHITPDGSGITVGLLHTGKAYPDDLSDDGVLYHYPSTERSPGRDLAEVNSTKAAGKLGLPVFVIIPGRTPATRCVRMAWVEEWDDNVGVFLISFGESRPVAAVSTDDDDAPFDLTDAGLRRRAQVKVRLRQQRFKFQVMRRYGPCCAVCGINIVPLLDAAHLCPKDHAGSDDPRNGIVLCASHHRALDAGLFGIDPNSTVHVRLVGPGMKELRISYRSLTHLPRQPHRRALEWRWKEWSYRDGKSAAE